MDVPSEQSTPAGAGPPHLTPREAVRSRRRRPTGAPPPLPHHLQTSGVGWLVVAVVLVGLALAVFAPGLRGPAVAVTVADDAVVRWLGELHAPGLEVLWQVLAYGGSWWTLATLESGLLLALLVLRRWRHLLVWLVAWPVVNALAYGLVATAARRPRPFGVDLRTGLGRLGDAGGGGRRLCGRAGRDPVHAGARGSLAQHRQVGGGRAGGAGRRRPDRVGCRRPGRCASRGGHRGRHPAAGFPSVCSRSTGLVPQIERCSSEPLPQRSGSKE